MRKRGPTASVPQFSWQALHEKVLKAHADSSLFFLLLDYDGTLAPIAPTPDEAVLNTDMHNVVQALACSRRVRVGIISGRSLKDVRHHSQIEHVIYAGNHGFEIKGKEMAFIHPKAKKARPVLRQIKRKLLQALSEFPSAFVEDKNLTLSIHHRLVQESKHKKIIQIVHDISRPYILKRAVKLTKGKRVVEIRPNASWDKGEACKWLMTKIKSGSVFPIYLGDDQTDESAFKVINHANGISILVANQPRRSAAHFRFHSTEEVLEFLGWIRELVST